MQQQNPHNPQQPQQPQQVMMPPMMPPQGMPPGNAQGQMMPPPQVPPRPRVKMTWRQRILGGIETKPLTLRQEREIPNWIIGSSVAVFFTAMLACWVVFGYVPGFDLVSVASISIILFFYGGNSMAQKWSRTKEKTFLRNVFIAGLLIRLLLVMYYYFVFNPIHYGNTYGDDADTGWYMRFGQDLAQWIAGNSRHTLSSIIDYQAASIDDTGYPMWLGVIYLLTGGISDVFIPFVVKSILGAYCAISIYRVAKRHFGEGAARMAAIFICLNPNMIYWCGTMMKETEMVFLVCLAVDNFDKVLSSGQKYTFKALLPGMLAALALMFFRTVLGIVMFLAVFSHIVMASSKVMSVGKKILAGVLVGAVLFVGMGDRIRTQSKKLVEVAQSDSQYTSMKSRSRNNTFAQYAGAAVFAPLIFTIPFPTFNQAAEVQLTQPQLAGGSFIKNVLSFFVIYVLFLMLINGEWRRHVFIIAYTLGYHMVLVMSAFAQSGRFHMPVMPMIMLFAAYGVQLAKTNTKIRKWWPMVLVAEVVICLAWNWFKLKGRGMI